MAYRTQVRCQVADRTNSLVDLHTVNFTDFYTLNFALIEKWTVLLDESFAIRTVCGCLGFAHKTDGDQVKSIEDTFELIFFEAGRASNLKFRLNGQTVINRCSGRYFDRYYDRYIDVHRLNTA